jgi:hypothetical protein
VLAGREALERIRAVLTSNGASAAVPDEHDRAGDRLAGLGVVHEAKDDTAGRRCGLRKLGLERLLFDNERRDLLDDRTRLLRLRPHGNSRRNGALKRDCVVLAIEREPDSDPEGDESDGERDGERLGFHDGDSREDSTDRHGNGRSTPGLRGPGSRQRRGLDRLDQQTSKLEVDGGRP